MVVNAYQGHNMNNRARTVDQKDARVPVNTETVTQARILT